MHLLDLGQVLGGININVDVFVSCSVFQVLVRHLVYTVCLFV